MATVEMVMPKMGESVMEGTVITWLKKEGESIEEDEAVLEVATDKVDTEIPSTSSGKLKKIIAKEGDVIPVGAPIAIIETDGEMQSGKPEEIAPPADNEDAAQKASELLNAAMTHSAAAPEATTSTLPKPSESRRFYSPLVRNIAREENISLEELESITGTGKEGRVTKKDILGYLKDRKKEEPVAIPTTVPTNGHPTIAPEPVPLTVSGSDEIIEMDRMRKMIAERMVTSKAISAHVTSFVEADVTRMVSWRNRVKDAFKAREGESLTYTPIIIEAVVKAIREFPMINIQVDGDKIIKKGVINIGMAVALPSGNLIVPVIHNADQLSLLGLTRKVNDLAGRARENKLHPDELSGGTFSVSNVGSFGNVMGTPIIVQPQVAILALGAIQKKPSVIETPEGDLIGIRHKMFLSHSYDHRVVDGALGGMFVRKVADNLEQFDINRNI